jgi:pimeloyl-ACP methyl ester carboxylesterase
LSVVIIPNVVDLVVEIAGKDATLVSGKHRGPLTNVVVTADKISFTLEKPNFPEQTWEHFDLVRHGDRADGTDVGSGQRMIARMVKLAEGEAPHSAFARPQTPKPPFPYEQRELVVDAPDGGKLAGTLTLPAGKGPFPVVLLLSGSGQQDRDETIFNHKPYLVVSDRLTRAGIATYRFDDRGTGKTVGAMNSLDTEVADAGAIVDVLAKQPELDPKMIGVIGHSAGGMVAPNVALAHPVAFIVLLAGATLPGRDYAAFQTAHKLQLAGASEADLARQRDDQKRVMDAMVKSPKDGEAALTELTTAALERRLGRKPTDDEVKKAVAKPLAEMANPWMLSYFRIDPREAWRKLAIPVLVLDGDKDTQVPADITIAAVVDAMGTRAPVTTHKLPGLNHLFQHAITGELDEYATNEETFAPEALDLITAWIVERTRR